MRTPTMWDFHAPSGLAGFTQSSCSVALWRRQPRSDFRVLIDCIRGDLAEFRQLLSPAAVEQSLAAAFPARFWRSSLARPWLEDVTALVDMFCQESACAQCCVRLESLRTAAHFHTDSHSLQLVCSYRGPGISWLGEDNVDFRLTDGWPYREEEIVLRPHEVHQANERDVVLLKGRSANTLPVYHKGPSRRPQDLTSWILRMTPAVPTRR
ncbi:MAG: DUF1826 domain-containing protein [Candidatus Eremiobacteraeota bacterium]|nr:DUF1826 domain-containing protein [Candidatus Eremiobacteraeota bacterium]MCW5871023.1 DUF1826 domain-containing protein [Candidatus Eremiobacteraeota bacterium]